MSDSASSAPRRRRISSSGRREDVQRTPPDPLPEADGSLDLDRRLSSQSDLPHKAPGDPALLHLLDGHYIKRHTVEPWNTSGGYCDVFTGDHPTFGKVALKRPRMSRETCTQRQLESLMLEGNLWKKLSHPNVLQFVGMILSDSRVWLVSIFATNGTLHEYLHKYPMVDRYNLVVQFTRGLAYLHSQNVVHGDLKSPNLLVSINHELLIGDFGLSKFTDGGMTTATSKKGAGSLQWMAPELLMAENPTKTFLSDAYAYGITISEILTGELPFKEYKNIFALPRAITENNIRPPTLPLVSPQGRSYEIPWAVAKDCWDPEPSKRPSMIAVCQRFSMGPTNTVDDATISDPTRALETAQASSDAELTTTDSQAPQLTQDTDSNAQPLNGIPLPNNIDNAQLLQLLGNAEYGDIGHMRDDGLCLDGTRTEVLGKLDAWADDPTSPRVKLVKGQAGRGKSTIARTVSSRFRNRWGGSASSAIFHFRRGNEAVNNRPLRALARQLACSDDQRVSAAILKSVQEHEDIAQLRLEDQFEILLVQSLKDLQPHPPRILLVIDALDESSDNSLVSALLRLISKYAPSLPSTVKFLLTSRPEEYILVPYRASFDEVQEDLDTVDLALIDRDVRSYFMVRLSEIRRDFRFESDWVSQDAINELVSLSQGLFQWAHAAMEYVRERPRLNLQRLIWSPTPVLGLPALYRQILSTAFPIRDHVKDEGYLLTLIQHVIGSLVVGHRPISPTILEYLWDHHTNLPPSSHPAMEIRENVLGRLGSMIMLPSSPEGPIYFMHISVRDFFTDSAQCQDARFLIEPTSHHARLADTCLYRMKRDLQHDICGINNPSKMNSEVLDLVERRISSGLRYCCRSWATHLLEMTDDGSDNCTKVQAELEEFCTERLLHWLEVLSLIGSLSEVFDMVHQALQWVKTAGTPQSQAITHLLSDTGDFCRWFFKLMSSNAQHITLSYLLHFPAGTALRNTYNSSIGQQVPQIIRGPALQRSDWSSVIHTGSIVLCVAWSPDGKTLASGLRDRTIRLWSIDTGEQIGAPLAGHTDDVRSVAFSQDGKTLASGSDGGTIRRWSVDTGEQKGMQLIGHTGRVLSIAFSPDGKTLASGSDDQTIRRWSVDTGEQIGTPLAGHPGYVRIVAFSPDGKTLASGSDGGTIWRWSVDTWEQKGMPLIGHTGWVQSIAFSPDGKTLASGSTDHTIRLYAVETGEQKGMPLIGHTGSVQSIAFSPDGKTLASGSTDHTIRLYAVETGEWKARPLNGHTDAITCIAISPDSATLASGSKDSTIRLWSMDTGEQKGEPFAGHQGCIRSVVFLPDGHTLASGSDDKTLRLWNVDTGGEKERLAGHKSPVTSLALLRDGKTLASRSGDAKFHWRFGRGMPIRTTVMVDHQDLKNDRSSVRIGATSPDRTRRGWVFIRNKMCFWLPEHFYLCDRGEVPISLCGKFLVIHHPDIYILDISAFL